MSQITSRVGWSEEASCCAQWRLSTQQMWLWWPAARVTHTDVWLLEFEAVLPSIPYVLAVSTCETPPRDSPKLLGGTLQVLGLFPVVVESVKAGKTQATNSHLLRLSLFFHFHVFASLA